MNRRVNGAIAAAAMFLGFGRATVLAATSTDRTAACSDAPVPLGRLRVRPEDALAKSLLEEGHRESATFAALVTELEQSDVVVYVDAEPRTAEGPSGRLQFIGSGGGLRYVHVRLEAGSTSWSVIAHRRDQLVAILAHELQHAAEVAAAPAADDIDGFAALYLASGIKTRDHSYDTPTARQVGARVLAELRGSPGGCAIDER